MLSNMTRRRFLSCAALAAGCRAGAAPFDAPPAIDATLARIRPPRFPERDFPIPRYGAKEGGREPATAALAAAIAACAAAGGGRVTVPPGRFLTGAIHMKSNVDLHLEEGATLLFSNNPKDYLPLVYTRFEGTECMNYSPLIYAWEQTNLAVTGSGVLDGQADADHWWPMKTQARRAELVAAGRPRCAGAGARLRRRRRAATEFLPALQMQQHPGGRCLHPALAHVGAEPGAMPQRDGAKCKNFEPRPE